LALFFMAVHPNLRKIQVSSAVYRELLYIKLIPYTKVTKSSKSAPQCIGNPSISSFSLYQITKYKQVSSAVYRELLYIKLFPYTKAPRSSKSAPFCIGNSAISSYFSIPKLPKLSAAAPQGDPIMFA